jgi:hypothetical protein
MDNVPSGFTRIALRGADAVLRDDVAGALAEAGIADPESFRVRATASYEGRGRPFGVGVPGAGRVFVRQYLHGGALRRVTGELYRGEGRFLAELAALVGAARAGVPVGEALGVVSRPAGMGMRRGWLLARELPGAVDAMTLLSASPPPARRRAVLEAAGRAIRALHDAGFEHPDLHLKNLLVAADGRVLVVDLDGARRHEELPRPARLAGVFRFDRYAAKQAARGLPVSRADRLRALKAYAGRDWPRRDELREIARKLSSHIRRHEAVRG